MQSNHIPQPALNQPDDEIDLKRLFFILLRKWYWFLACLFLSVSLAFLFGKYRSQAYLVDTSIIIPQKNKAFNLETMFGNQFPGMADMSISTEVELLRSYTLNYRVVENLNWRTIWFQREVFGWKGLYTNEPFRIREHENEINIEDIWIEIRPEADSTYLVSASGTGMLNNAPVDINCSSAGKFGEDFQNEFFNFTLYLKDDISRVAGERFRFRFTNRSRLTLEYLERLNIASADKLSDVIRLSVQGTEALREIRYLNELVRVYLDLKLEQQTTTQKRSLQFIDNQLSGISDSLIVAGTTFTEFRSRNQIIDLSAQGELVMTQLGDIEKNKSQQQMQLEYFVNLLAYLGKSDGIKQVVTPSVVGIQDPSLNALVLKLSELYSRREVLSFSAYENNPTLVLLNKEISQVNEQLRENLVNLIDNARLTIQNLDARYHTMNAQLNNLPGQEQELINIRRQYDLTSEIYTYLLQKRAEIEISLASTVVDIQIIDPARVERIRQTGISSKMLILLGALIGLIIPAFFILLVEMADNKIHQQEDVERSSPLTIIGNVFHSKSKSDLVVFENPTAPITESFRAIRTNLQYKFTQAGQKVIGIHSMIPGEGKTFCATNLACILAMNDKKTLLIGADLRKPRLDQIFGFDNLKGLSTYLIGHHRAQDVVRETYADNLWLIPSGPIPPNPAELLERVQFAELLEWAKNEFDYVVIDNAPVSMVTDGIITGRLVDLNIFVLRYGLSRKDQLKQINDIAFQSVMNKPSLVINDIKFDQVGYRHVYAYYGQNGKA